MSKMLSLINRRFISSSTPALIIKDSCLSKLRKIIPEPSKEYLRIDVENGGCSGFKYIFKIEQNHALNLNQDLVFERQGYRLIVDQEIFPFLKGSKIAYDESLIKSSFTVENPLAETNCGCGSSFSIKKPS